MNIMCHSIFVSYTSSEIVLYRTNVSTRKLLQTFTVNLAFEIDSERKSISDFGTIIEEETKTGVRKN